MVGDEIIVTIGPSSDSVTCLRSLSDAGATNFRINLSHSSLSSVDRLLGSFAEASLKASLDTQGAQLRTSSCSATCHYIGGDDVSFSFLGLNPVEYNFDFLLNHAEALHQLVPGDILRVDFDGLAFQITTIHSTYVDAKVTTSGILNPNKSVDIIGKHISLNPFTTFDLEVIRRCSSIPIERIYVSFANRPQDILTLRQLLDELNYSHTEIIAKIETIEALSNLPEIISVSDGVLIDRGDLSREISISKIPYAVDTVISIAKQFDSKCYVATNVLDSMIASVLPLRSEISDLHSLLHKGVTGIVLAAEVAIGKYPVNCVHVVRHMQNVCRLESYAVSDVIPRSFLASSLPIELQQWL